MGLPFSVLIGFLSLVWLGLMLINAAGLARSKEGYQKVLRKPKVLVMVPCRGAELTLMENLESLKKQDYKDYDVVAIVDDKNDKAIPAIKAARIRWIVSSKTNTGGGGKVRAMLTAMRRFRNYDVYVNIDSDVSCKKNHISELVAPLSDRNVGVSTAYPYFMPLQGFWSVVKMVWGFVGNGMMESKLTRFVWGGSMAFRKNLMDNNELGVFGRALSDDMVIAHFAKKKGLRIFYVNKGTIVVNTKETVQRLIEWSNRQTALSILGNRRVLYYGVAFYFAQALLLAFGVALSFVSPLYIILLAPFVIGVAKTYRRANRAYLSIPPICFMINFLFLANLLVAARMTHIEWRGSRYRLQNPF